MPELERALGGHDVVVSDGGSTDRTRALARRFARVVVGPRGRAAQLNRGARAAQGDWLLFLHADTRLPPGALAEIPRSEGVGGCFLVRFDRPGLLLGMGDAFRNTRTRLFHDFYGDQAIFARRDVFERLGGFRPFPFMEDYDFCRRLRAAGRLRIIPTPAVTSARRYTASGTVRQHLRFQWMKVAHRFHAPARRAGAALAIFARAPQPGRVKTRLAAEIGARSAADLYAAFLQDLLAAHRNGPTDLVLYTDPADCTDLFPGLNTASQIGGDLGERLDWAVREQLARVLKVVVIGSDLPEIEPRTIQRAVAALDDHDVVLGPSFDGGYYLVALKEPHPIFEAIDWSTERVLDQTLRRARGLRVFLLETRRDIDTLEDLRAGAAGLARLAHTGRVLPTLISSEAP